MPADLLATKDAGDKNRAGGRKEGKRACDAKVGSVHLGLQKVGHTHARTQEFGLASR